MKSNKLILSTLLVTTCAGVWFATRSDQKEDASLSSSISSVRIPSVELTDTAKPSLGLRKGDRLIYDFQRRRLLELESNFGPGDRASEPQYIDTVYQQEGKLIVTVYETTTNGWLVGFLARDVESLTETGGRARKGHPSDLEMQREVLTQVATNGRISKMTSAGQEVSEQCLNQWRELLSRWQVVLSENASDPFWETEEEDSTGTFVAGYSRNTNQLTKRKKHYSELHGENVSSFGTNTRIRSEIDIEMAPYQHTISGNESLHLPLPELKGKMTSEVDFSFELTEAVADPEILQLAASMQQLHDAGTQKRFSWATSKEFRDSIAKIAGRDERSSIEKLDAFEALLAAGKHRTGDEVSLLHTLADEVRENDQAVEDIVDRLARNQIERKAYLSQGLYGVLGSAGTETAQLALSAIAQSGDWKRDQRNMALLALLQSEQPIPDAEEASRNLHSVNGDYSSTALQVLGAMGHKLKSIEPERFQSISEYIVDQSTDLEMDNSDAMIALSAISNLGPEEIPEISQRAFKSDDASVRLAAVKSLKRIDTPEAGQMISEALVSDESDSVREAAVSSLRNPGLDGGRHFEALTHAATNDRSEKVRLAAAQSLGYWTTENPQAMAVLSNMVESDASEAVRNAAKGVVQLETTEVQ